MMNWLREALILLNSSVSLIKLRKTQEMSLRTRTWTQAKKLAVSGCAAAIMASYVQLTHHQYNYLLNHVHDICADSKFQRLQSVEEYTSPRRRRVKYKSEGDDEDNTSLHSASSVQSLDFEPEANARESNLVSDEMALCVSGTCVLHTQLLI